MANAEKPLVFLAANLPPDLVARIEAECRVRPRPGRGPMSRDEVFAALDGASAMIGTPTRMDETFFAGLKGVRVISLVSVGYDHVDIDAATRAGALVCHTPGVLSHAVAELTMGLMISVARRFPENAAYTRSGGWGRSPLPPFGSDLRGKTLGIIGFGRIGKVVARRAAAFDMNVWYHDVLRPSAEEAAEFHERDELLRNADFVSLHVDLNPTSRKLISDPELALMKPTAYLINTSRGPVVDQPALVRALREGRIAGAALDVVDPEPPAPDDPILTLPNALIVPHIGTSTTETRRAMQELAVENLLDGLRGEKPRTPVNPQVLG